MDREHLGLIAASNYFGVYAATSASPAPAPVLTVHSGISGDSAFYMTPPGDMIGDGGLIVFDTWKSNPIGCVGSFCYGPSKMGGVLYGVENGKAVRLASSAGGVTPLSVDAGLVLVDRGGGLLELLHDDGTVERSFQLNPALVHGARLQGRDLVVLTPTALEVTDAETGAFLRRWRVPPDAELVDVQDGVALLTAGTKLHLLRLGDGGDTVIDVPGSPPIRAQLEPGLLFYSYRAADPDYPGRVVVIRQ